MKEQTWKKSIAKLTAARATSPSCNKNVERGLSLSAKYYPTISCLKASYAGVVYDSKCL